MNKFFIMKLFALIMFFLILAVGLVYYFKFYINTDTSQIITKRDIAKKAGEVFTHNLIPISSNQWYSNIYKEFPTQPIFAFPLTFKISDRGLSFSSPHIKAARDTVYAPFVEDFILGIGGKLDRPDIAAIGDWHITLRHALSRTKNTFFSYTIAHGIPYATVRTNAENIHLTFRDSFALFNNNSKQQTGDFRSKSFVVVTNNNSYIFVIPDLTDIHQSDKELFFKNKGQIFIGLLDQRKNYDLFLRASSAEIISTAVEEEISGNKMYVKYHYRTVNNKEPLLALFPHHFDNLKEKYPVRGIYHSVRGDLRLVQSDNFETVTDLIIPQESFPSLRSEYSDLNAQIKSDIDTLLKKGPPDSKDYFLGTWFGKADNLLLLADLFGLNTEKQKLIAFLKPIFENSLKDFYYDSSQTSLLAKHPEFGNEKLNDHHFHYGYYIRTAAVLSRFDPDIIPASKKIINMMVNDIANIDPGSTQFPYLRNFDIYESHSWADGYAGFADGNNQESTSEAVNAWYSVYLWSRATNNSRLSEKALYLYNSEIQGALYYWFNKANIYPLPYGHKIASIVWGGKVDFATWFSAEANMIYGIQLLPLTPASDYLSLLPDFDSYWADYRKSGGQAEKPWGDLFTVWKSYYYPEEALSEKEKVNELEDNNSRSIFLYMLYKNSQI